LALIWQNNEKALLEQVANGDEKAFRLLFDTYRNRLFFYTLQITSSREMAEDVVQDTFLKIWLRKDQLSRIDHFNAYIFKMAQNGVLSGLRRKAIEEAILEGKMEAGTPEPDIDQKLHFKQVKGVLQLAVDNLPPQQRSVYLLRREEDRQIREIARLMGISEVTVKRHLTQAQKTLRQALLDAFPYESSILIVIFGILYF
jgi:RNA polymerase sigma-70 factor (family 1)